MPMMIRKLFPILLLLVTAFPLSPRAGEIGPSEKIPPGGTLRGHFSEDHYFQNSNRPFHSEGQFLVAPGRGLIWKVENPVPFIVVVTPAGMSQGIGDTPFLKVSSARVPFLSQVTGMLTDAFTGRWDGLESDFLITRKATATGWLVQFTPRPSRQIIPFRTLVAEGGQFVDKATLTNHKGGEEVVTFSDQTVSASPPEPAEITAFQAIP